jgi:hypothetical protein
LDFSAQLKIGNGSVKWLDMPSESIFDMPLAESVFGEAISREDFDALGRRIIICTTNEQVDSRNKEALRLLPDEDLFCSHAVDRKTRNGPPLEHSWNPPRFPPEDLELRRYAIVMMLKTQNQLPNGLAFNICEKSTKTKSSARFWWES